MIAKKVRSLVKMSILWAVWDCGVTKTAFWKIARLYVCSQIQHGHATVQAAMFNVARVDITVTLTPCQHSLT